MGDVKTPTEAVKWLEYTLGFSPDQISALSEASEFMPETLKVFVQEALDAGKPHKEISASIS